MRLGLLAEKVGMSRFYDENKINHSVTLLKVKDCKIISIKEKEKHGYSAVALSHDQNSKKISKPFKSFLKKNNLKPFSKSKEFRVSDSTQYKIGQAVNVSNFVVGQFIDVSSNSIGKGFAGGMKRHNFSGNRATHGVSISHRSHGSTGQCQDPGKVFKGKKMAGRLGNKKVTIQNLKVLNIDLDNNLLIVKGAVPGHKGSIIKIVDAVKKNQTIDVVSPKIEKNEEVNDSNVEVKKSENLDTNNKKEDQIKQNDVSDQPQNSSSNNESSSEAKKENNGKAEQNQSLDSNNSDDDNN